MPLCFFFFLFVAAEGSSLFLCLHSVKLSFFGFLAAYGSDLGEFNDREHFSWHSVVALFGQPQQLMSTSTSGLAGHPVNDDEGQTHDHEDKAQASKAGSLWK